MQEITTIGLDIAKLVFQVHGIDASGAVIVRRQLRRSQVLPFFGKLPARDRRMSAVHEAGHFVIAVELGSADVSAMIWPQEVEEPMRRPLWVGQCKPMYFRL